MSEDRVVVSKERRAGQRQREEIPVPDPYGSQAVLWLSKKSRVEGGGGVCTTCRAAKTRLV